MGIWDYSSQTRDDLLRVLAYSTCPYCWGNLQTLPKEPLTQPWGDTEEWRIYVCQQCGWWRTEKWDHLHEGRLSRTFRTGATAGALKTLDLADIRTPLEEVRSYLSAKYESRYDLDPCLFEQTVASVFKDYKGYRVIVTGRSGDGGIDVLLTADEGQTIGVQVKRYQGSIEAAQIRELIGALVTNGMTKGVFVTTSRFRSGAIETAGKAASVGYEIELIDGHAFFEVLKIAQRNAFTPLDADVLVKSAKLEFIQFYDH